MFHKVFLIRLLESLSLLLSRNARISAEQHHLSRHPSNTGISGKEPFSEIISRASEKYNVNERLSMR